MKTSSVSKTATKDYTACGENLLAFETLELKACCARKIINEWEDYILVQPEYMANTITTTANSCTTSKS